MAEILVEKQICASCGANVRPGALFCYNCGGAVSSVPDKIENKNGNGANGDFAKRKNTTQTQLKDKKKSKFRRKMKCAKSEINGERELR
jgi:predicted amidophosphoribosyltransferase